MTLHDIKSFCWVLGHQSFCCYRRTSQIDTKTASVFGCDKLELAMLWYQQNIAVFMYYYKILQNMCVSVGILAWPVAGGMDKCLKKHLCILALSPVALIKC